MVESVSQVNPPVCKECLWLVKHPNLAPINKLPVMNGSVIASEASLNQGWIFCGGFKCVYPGSAQQAHYC